MIKKVNKTDREVLFFTDGVALRCFDSWDRVDLYCSVFLFARSLKKVSYSFSYFSESMKCMSIVGQTVRRSFLVAFMALSALSCVSKKEYESMKEAYEKAEEQNQKLRKWTKDLEKEVAQLKADSARLIRKEEKLYSKLLQLRDTKDGLINEEYDSLHAEYMALRTELSNKKRKKERMVEALKALRSDMEQLERAVGSARKKEGER